MQFGYDQQKHIGYRAVIEMLEPSSPYGREALRRLTPYSPEQREELQECLDNIEKTMTLRPEQEKSYRRLEQLMRQVKDIRGSLTRCRDGGVLGEVDLFEIKRYLLQLSEIHGLFEGLNTRAGYGGIAFTDTGEALKLLDPEGNQVATFHISGRYSPELTRVRREKRELEQKIREADASGKEALTAARSALAAAEQEEEEKVCRSLSGQLRPHMQPLLDNGVAIARLDLTIQKAALAARHNCCKPEIGGDSVWFEEMVNPQIAAYLTGQGKAFTPLTLELSRGVTVITGANMGGKSVALKTAALNILLVHCGLYPFAAAARCPLFHSMHLISEDLEAADRGLSSFGGEIARLDEALEDLEQGFSLLLMDEFARGTNPGEGAAIAQGVVEYLDGKDAVTVMTTHYDGVADRGSAHYQVVGLARLDLAEVRRKIGKESPQKRVDLIGSYMDYGLVRVTENQAMPRDAVNICRLLGLEQALLDAIEKNLQGD